MQQGKDHPYANVVDGMMRITREEGFLALWTGTVPAAMRAALLTSSQLATYDQWYVQLYLQTSYSNHSFRKKSTALFQRLLCS